MIDHLENGVHFGSASPAGGIGLDGREFAQTQFESEYTATPWSEPESLRVLIADDAALTRRFLRAVLENCGQFEVAGEARDGDMAVAMAQALQPDVVLLDLVMPRVYGTSALSRIRLVAPNAMVIVVSGLDSEFQSPVLEAGATAFLPKGVAPLEFLELLGAIFERSLGAECGAGYRAEMALVSERIRTLRSQLTTLLGAQGADGRWSPV